MYTFCKQKQSFASRSIHSYLLFFSSYFLSSASPFFFYTVFDAPRAGFWNQVYDTFRLAVIGGSTCHEKFGICCLYPVHHLHKVRQIPFHHPTLHFTHFATSLFVLVLPLPFALIKQFSPFKHWISFTQTTLSNSAWTPDDMAFLYSRTYSFCYANAQSIGFKQEHYSTNRNKNEQIDKLCRLEEVPRM